MHIVFFSSFFFVSCRLPEAPRLAYTIFFFIDAVVSGGSCGPQGHKASNETLVLDGSQLSFDLARHRFIALWLFLAASVLRRGSSSAVEAKKNFPFCGARGRPFLSGVDYGLTTVPHLLTCS